MLGDKNCAANIAVTNLDAARTFYEGTLGLKQIGADGEEAVVFKSGDSTIIVYRSQYAGTNRATTVTWMVGEDLVNTVSELKSKGVTFEHYDLPGLTREGDIHSGGNTKVAWFKDPEGNILGLSNG